ncbi:nucleoside hydrolase [Arcanobacterium canis]|uniref:Nucleoside hydrolase n=1 Tax=Arcanobacterium canis TaxID=999183 RepID=A0ABY8G141_9ACTO|nr:nucleoside hydrolase [Arcanobacterium canis]WFM83006.1 nucleoside hydrolase [Arcanobacterium canis]
MLFIDVDTGIDDALALAFMVGAAKAGEFCGRFAMIASYGNVTQARAEVNTRAVLALLGRTDIDVWQGPKHPSWASGFIPDAGCALFHGDNGLGGVDPRDFGSDISSADIGTDTHLLESVERYVTQGFGVSIGGYRSGDRHANPAPVVGDLMQVTTTSGQQALAHTELSQGAQKIIDALEHSPVTVVTVGPLTTVDQVLRARPELAERLRIVSMGGAVTQPGNCWGAVAETNMIQDPEAADRVFHSGADVTLVPLDVTHQVLCGAQAIESWRVSEAGNFFTQIAKFSITANARSSRIFAQGMPLHDPLAVAVALDPSLVSILELPMCVETQTSDTHGVRGRTIGDPYGLNDPSATRIRMAIGVNREVFLNRFIATVHEAVS